MSLLPLAVETPEFLGEIVALLVGGALVAYVGARLGLVPIVGFLIAGVVIGPNALGIVDDRDIVDAAAEVGVILLLFTIGLELSLERVARLRRLIFGVGGLQVILTTIAGAAVALAVGAGIRTAIEELGMWGARMDRAAPAIHQRSIRAIAMALQAILVRSVDARPGETVVLELEVDGEYAEVVLGPKPIVTARPSIQPDARVAVSTQAISAFLLGGDADGDTFRHLSGSEQATQWLRTALGVGR